MPRALVMIDMLRQHAAPLTLWVLCMDDACYADLARRHIAGINLIRLNEFEQNDDALRIAKGNRSPIEYYFTCTPSLPLFVLQRHPDIAQITYIDADFCFYSSPEPIFDEIGANSIAITPHRFAKQAQKHANNGKYNVGWLSFRNDVNGLACLNWWRERCLEWCHDYVEGERFADQKYLDPFNTLFAGVHDIQHKGMNLGPWNVGQYDLSLRQADIWVDEQRLIAYHFHGLKQIRPGVFDTRFGDFGVTPSSILRNKVYRPYIQAI